MSDTPEKTEKKEEETAEAVPPAGVDGPPDDKVEAEAEAKEPEDDASPEAIARRVAALGDEDELEKLARTEEQKLAERRAKMKRGKKGGLEAAASKRLNKIAEKAQPKKMIATAVDGADPLLNQTAKVSKWARDASRSRCRRRAAWCRPRGGTGGRSRRPGW